MTRVVDTLDSDELDGDLAGWARRVGGRKATRLLARVSLAPFVVAAELHGRQPAGDLDRAALFTVGDWMPAIPRPAVPFAPGPDLVRELSSFHQHPANPLDWLRRMPNHVLCQVAVATGMRGPNAHYLGGADALHTVLTLAAAALRSGEAATALVVAFDPVGDRLDGQPDEQASAAAAVLLAAGDDDGRFAAVAAAAGTARGSSALTVLRAGAVPARAPR